MIADEVGMGKTIEASAVLKVFLKDNHNSKILIIVPDALVEQWRTELAYKFKILEGFDVNNNEICLTGMSNINSCLYNYDFVIADEVHKYLQDDNKYRSLLMLSRKTKNILMLSATPVQRRKEEYKKLLQLIQPSKYISMSDERFDELLELQGDVVRRVLSATPVQRRKEEYKKLLQLIQPSKYISMSDERFDELLELQGDVVRRVHETLEDLDSYLEEIEESNNERTEDTEDAFDDVIDSLKRINKLINDDTFKEMYQKVDYEAEDFGVEEIQTALAYVCENYQFEKSIIRNRRNENEDYNTRELVEIPYDMQTRFNNTEYNTYKELAAWIESQEIDYEVFVKQYRRIVSAFLSSASAFENALIQSKVPIPSEILHLAKHWKQEELDNCNKIFDYLDDPTDYMSRMNNIVDYIDQEACGKKVLVFTNFDETFKLYKNVFENYFGKEHCAFFSKNNIVDYIDQEACGKKVLVFTNFDETFKLYKNVFENYFGKEHCAFFSKNMETDERELGAYRFETDKDCWILLSDESGGEGRNFQNADILVHIDMPWSANDLEQRIGRLDRIGREKGKSVVSVVCYSKETLEEDLYKFWNEGIGIFTKSQSGLEIIMNSMDEKIIKAVCDDFKYGLISIIEDVEKELKELKEIIKRERYFDVAEYKYQTLNRIMDDTREMYVANEKQLFTDSMMRWSALSGFRGRNQGKSMIRFDASSFSLKSASNSLFVPPDIRLMISDRINQLQNRVRAMNGDRTLRADVNYVQGTFDRQKGLDNDYIHFFAPGDAIFDSIVNNAINSYKGTCSAFACKTDINWEGFIFTWAIFPDESNLLEKGISTHVIDKYRGFMPIEQFQCAISIGDNDDVAEEVVLKVFNYLLTSDKINRKQFQHLGERSGLHPNIERFIDWYPTEIWKQNVKDGYSKAFNLAKKKISQKLVKQLFLLKTELSKNSGAMKATSNFYMNHNDNDVEQINDLILKCFSKPKIVLDSVCYVRMIND